MLVHLRDRLRLNGKISFSRRELNQILSIYGARVQNGEWRDYAIDSTADAAVFSIFRSSQESPLYRLTKTISKDGLIKPSQYTVYSGNKVMKQSADLRDILAFLDKET